MTTSWLTLKQCWFAGPLCGLIAHLCRSDCSFRLLGVQRPGGFCLPTLNAFGAGYKTR